MKNYGWKLLLLAVIAALSIVIATAESYTLVVDGPLRILNNPNAADAPENVALVMLPGQEAVVVECIDYKTDIAVGVLIPSSRKIGYVSDGPFRLRKEKSPLKHLFSKNHQIVWSCRNFYNNRKFY